MPEMSWFPGAEWASQEDLIAPAITAALLPIAEMEAAWERPILPRRLCRYFSNGAKGLDFHGQSLEVLINQYADNVFGSIFQALHDRPWINQAVFLVVLDAGVNELFPRPVVTSVSPQRFERIITAAHDRAFEKQRFAPLLWNVVAEYFKEPEARKKVFRAFETGRKEAATAYSTESPDPLTDFVYYWVSSSIAWLALNAGSADSLLPPGVAVQFVHALVAAGALPLPLTEGNGIPPPDWPAVENCVRAAYAPANQGKGKDKGKDIVKGPTLQWARHGVIPPGKVGGKASMGPHNQWQAAAAGKGGSKQGKQQNTDTFEATDGASLAGQRMGDQKSHETDSCTLKRPKVGGPVTNGHLSGVGTMKRQVKLVARRQLNHGEPKRQVELVARRRLNHGEPSIVDEDSWLLGYVLSYDQFKGDGFIESPAVPVGDVYFQRAALLPEARARMRGQVRGLEVEFKVFFKDDDGDGSGNIYVRKPFAREVRVFAEAAQTRTVMGELTNITNIVNNKDKTQPTGTTPHVQAYMCSLPENVRGQQDAGSGRPQVHEKSKGQVESKPPPAEEVALDVCGKVKVQQTSISRSSLLEMRTRWKMAPVMHRPHQHLQPTASVAATAAILMSLR